MLRRRVGLLKWFTCLSAGVILCWCGRCEAYEPWKGEVTARVNVRKAPGETSPVITQIDQGAKVTVSDEKEGWYKVVVEEDTFGFIGWVYGQYVKIPTALSPTSSPSPQLQEKPGGLPSTSTTPAAAHAAPADGAPKAPPGKGAGSGGAVEKSGPADGKVSSAAGQNEGATDPVVKRSGNVFHHAPQEESVERKKTDPPESGKALVEEQAHSDEAALREASQEIENGKVPAVPSLSAASMSPGTHLEHAASAPVKELNAPSVKSNPVIGNPETKATGADDSKEGQVWRAVIGVVVKLVVVAFSCLALLFAHAAWQTTTARNEG